MANVFLSHRGADENEAERLAEEVRKAGHQVWLDKWELQPGDSIIDKINAGLTAADYVVVCYSTHGITSPWMAREWMSTLAAQLQGRKVKIIPALLTGGGFPAILADIKYVNLTKDWPAGVAELLRALR